MGRLILIALMSVIGLMIASWMLGEFIRQRKDK